MREGIQTTGIAIIYASSFGGHVAETAKYMAKELDADIFDLKKHLNCSWMRCIKIILCSIIITMRATSVNLV